MSCPALPGIVRNWTRDLKQMLFHRAMALPKHCLSFSFFYLVSYHTRLGEDWALTGTFLSFLQSPSTLAPVTGRNTRGAALWKASKPCKLGDSLSLQEWPQTIVDWKPILAAFDTSMLLPHLELGASSQASSLLTENCWNAIIWSVELQKLTVKCFAAIQWPFLVLPISEAFLSLLPVVRF